MRALAGPGTGDLPAPPASRLTIYSGKPTEADRESRYVIASARLPWRLRRSSIQNTRAQCLRWDMRRRHPGLLNTRRFRTAIGPLQAFREHGCALQAAIWIRSLHLAALHCTYLPGSLLGRFHAQSTKSDSSLRHRPSVTLARHGQAAATMSCFWHGVGDDMPCLFPELTRITSEG
jgi:hypothetical protein